MESRKVKWFLIFSFLSASLLTLLFFTLPFVIEAFVRSQVNILQGSILHKKWLVTPIPVSYKFYFFHIVNPRAVINGSKIKVKEIGPFCLLQFRRKRVISWSDDKKLVKYYEYKMYNWNSDKNCLDINKKLTIINVPIVSLVTIAKDFVDANLPFKSISNPVVFGVVNNLLQTHHQNLFTTRTAHEIIFGYKVNLFQTISKIVERLETLGFKNILPTELMKDNMFGILYGKNNTPEGPYEVYTGKGDTSYKFTEILKWKDEHLLKWWKGSSCNEIKGNDGSFFSPLLNKNNPIWSYSPDVCRSLKLSFFNESNYKGIPTFRYTLDLNSLGSPLTYEPNACFCTHDKKKYRCRFGGVIDASSCNSGAPLLISMPHFMLTTPFLGDTIDGIAPDNFKHGSYVEAEPITGLMLTGQKRLQFSIRVENINFLKDFSEIKEIIVPFFWAEEKASLTDELVHEINSILNSLRGLKIGILIATLITWMLLLIALILFCISLKKKKAESINIKALKKTFLESKSLQYPVRFFPIQNQSKLFKSLDLSNSFVLYPERLFLTSKKSKMSNAKQAGSGDVSEFMIYDVSEPASDEEKR